MEKRKLEKRKELTKGIRKYYRWARRYVYRVRTIEKECGGEITAC